MEEIYQDKYLPVRSSGILLPVSSLPSPYGIGCFDIQARNFIDFLERSGQSYWQILPLSPTGYGDSPYQSFSAFAGNPYFISFDALYEDGLLNRSDYADIRWGQSKRRVDYYTLYCHRESVLRKAYSRFTDKAALDEFIRRSHWFDEYSLYMVIKDAHKTLMWTQWDEPLREHHQDAIDRIRAEHEEDIYYHAFVQYQFDRQWQAIRKYAKSKGVSIIGDIPIYVSLDSADVWSNRRLFQLDENGAPLEISGCPPDYFAVKGQLWGNPLYDWGEISRRGYDWWILRFEKCFELYDVVRLDHFRGLESYFAIPASADTAALGKWKPGPGKEFIDAMKNAMPDARIIAEDLGFLTDEVRELLKYSGFPGMKIIQYAFDDREASDYLPHNYDANCVVYTGTHDNETLRGWIKNAQRPIIRHAMKYAGIRRLRDIPDSMIRLAMQSTSNLAVIPMQDWLSLDNKARFNIPSTLGGNNWRWRLEKKDINERLADKILSITRLYGRHIEPEKEAEKELPIV